MRRVIVQYAVFWRHGEAQLPMPTFDTSIQEENGKNLADDISKYASLNGKWIFTKKDAAPCFNIR